MKMTLPTIPTHLQNFLKIATPLSWAEAAMENYSILLIDHAHCERKAAAFALQLISKHPHHDKLLRLLSPIAREELLHFEKMLRLLKQKNIRLQPLLPCQYHKKLHEMRAKDDNQLQLIDDLIIAAIIEARSCERFYCLLPFLQTCNDEPVLKFYQHLAQAEQRHYEVYLNYAKSLMPNIENRIEKFIDIDNRHILSKDKAFRFHSGCP